jgi:uncharacterized coiled-coil protein SlyX
MIYSRKWRAQHDASCPFKMIACERACGEIVRRMRMGEHLNQSCGLRTVKCPLFEFGCITEILAKDMAQHTQSNQEAHLCIVISRMTEVQGVVVGQQKRISDLEEIAQRVPKLEETLATQGKLIVSLSAGVTGAAVLLKASEARSTKHTQDKVRWRRGLTLLFHFYWVLYWVFTTFNLFYIGFFPLPLFCCCCCCCFCTYLFTALPGERGGGAGAGEQERDRADQGSHLPHQVEV